MDAIEQTEIAAFNRAPRSERSEEVQHIIERMPTRFGFWVSMLVIGLVVLMLISGWVISYPDIVVGEITVSAQQAPVKLISGSVGKLKLLTQTQQPVNAGDYVAYLQNAAKTTDVLLLKSRLAVFNPPKYFDDPQQVFQSDLTLGELTIKYFNFVSATQDVYFYKKDNLFLKQRAGLQTLLNQQNQSLAATKEQLQFNQKSVALNAKFYHRDSVLFQKGFEPEADFDKTRISYLNVLQNYNSTKQQLIVINEKIDDTKNQLAQLDIKIREKEIQLKLNLNATYNDLVDNIKLWEQKYVFIAPFNGKVQFLRFWNNDQFVQPGDEMFTIIPRQNKVIGQCILPATGAGKVKIGQEVIVKLENYPYKEFGYLKGIVSNVSLTTNITKTKDQGLVNNYLVSVDLVNQLKTNFGTQLDFKSELKGTAEIVTRSRRLGSRLFDNVTQATSRD